MSSNKLSSIKSTSSNLKESLGVGLSVNDIREKEFNGESLTVEERIAVQNFDKFRISELNKQVSDQDFHKRYQELQIMAKLGDYKEFLKEQYSNL